MEWVSHLAGEPHSDQPQCVSPVLRALCISLNDGLEDEPRQRLRPYLSRTIGTAGDGLDPARAWMAMDWLIRVYTPAWLALAELPEPAAALRSLSPVLDEPSLHASILALKRAQADARARRCVARTVPWDAARSAARDAAWGCAGAAAWAAARLGVGDIAGDQARAAARSAAADAAAVVAREAIGPGADGGRAAAKASARAALAPTLAELHRSVLELLERMLPTEPIGAPLAASGPRSSGAELLAGDSPPA
jgi:hypothetical protein